MPDLILMSFWNIFFLLRLSSPGWVVRRHFGNVFSLKGYEDRSTQNTIFPQNDIQLWLLFSVSSVLFLYPAIFEKWKTDADEAEF